MPKFDMRVVQIDLARQIETVETVCRFMDVAAKAGLSREHFSRIFREYTGVTFKRFLTSLRLAVAYRLLVGTELSTMDIALSAGFPDSQNFSRHFKQHYGCPPAEYRRTCARPSARK